jgi:hypothetical protein
MPKMLRPFTGSPEVLVSSAWLVMASVKRPALARSEKRRAAGETVFI